MQSDWLNRVHYNATHSLTSAFLRTQEVWRSTTCPHFSSVLTNFRLLFYNKKSLSLFLIGSWPLSIRVQTHGSSRQRHATKTLALIFLNFYNGFPVFNLNLFDFENYIPEWENVSDQELVGQV